jgi:hypothetical protein
LSVLLWFQDSSQSLAFPTATAGTTIDVFSAAPLGVPVHGYNDSGPLNFNDTTKLQLDVFDVEALQDVRVAGFDLLFSGGLRFAHLNQAYNAFTTFAETVTFDPSNSVISSYSFTGVGPVVDLEARRAIGDSGLALYGCGRGALLFGSAHQTAFATVSTLGVTTMLDQSDAHDRVIPVAELELGLEYGERLGNTRVFAQIALVGQDWFGAGNASHSLITSENGVALPGTFALRTGLPSSGTTADSDLGFFGLPFRIGVNY